MPLIPLRGMSVFPGMVVHFDVGREKSIKALEAAMEKDQMAFLVTQKEVIKEDIIPADFYTVGCKVKVKQLLKMPDNLVRVLVEVQERREIVEFESLEPYFLVSTKPVRSVYYDTKENRTLIRMIRESFANYMNVTRKVATDLILAMDSLDDPDQLIDIIGANLFLDLEDSQRLIQETDVNRRLVIAYEILVEEVEMIKIEHHIDEKVRGEMYKHQREYYLREQIKVIQDELGEGDIQNEIEVYKERLDALEVEDEVRDKVLGELNRLNKVPQGSSEAGLIQTYVEWILDLPWNTLTEETVDVSLARKVLDEDHFALDKVKERILEYISVLQLSHGMKSPIICLVGPPGVGKTSIAKSIARALNRKYVRMSLGGMRDEAEIRGHRRTYIGAIPGRIIYNIKKCGTRNPLFLLDEVDKLGQDFKGDPASALLEVLDPEQNNTFTDHYMELPFDLSQVLFLTTANSLSTIPRPLLDRMEIIDVNGYVESEKVEIAKRYLIPKQLEIHGLKKSTCKISEGVIKNTIEYYTRESGVRELERKIAQICRVAAKEIVENDRKSISITQKNLEKFLGKHQYSFETVGDKKEVGVVNGLAWTPVGGDTLQIEVIVVDGTGKIEITGQLGDVMKESVKAGISYIRSKADALGVSSDFYSKKDIHLHVPEGAVPKDGPSAGITIATALVSALTNNPVPQNLAMTGEITLRGRVLPIGGLREKLTAAHRAGIKEIILPKENEKDLEDVPKVVLEALHIQSVASMAEVIEIVFNQL
ncbi:peptidase [Acetobacterium bakii]|uniref:Lon protease n=2 Tax=Acetobacterium bakii TaxID=52689 RepID=A0A0L6U305_9FIRM|nr:peptidase [Acetobacterium bakii]